MNQDCAIAGYGFSTPTIAFSAPYFNPQHCGGSEFEIRHCAAGNNSL
jgi:hypothetical protein